MSIITLPTSALSDVVGYAGQMVTDTWVLIALAIGLPLAFWVISKIIGLFRTRARS